MKVLALNGSPRLKASGTYHMLENLLAGMESAGAETEIIHVRKLDLKACIGCYTCWVRTPGECIFQDSMTKAIQSYNTADLVIFGTPLYHFSMTGILKDFIDRTLPRLEPWLTPHPDLPGVTFHPERFHKPTKMMLVSPCGFPEFEHFDALVATFKQMARMERLDYVGEILRPGAEVLSRRTHQDLFSAYYGLLQRAGVEIIEQGSISDALQEELRKDLFPVDKQAFYGLAENYWTEQMDRFKVPLDQRHTVPILAADLDSASLVPGDKPELAQANGRSHVSNEHLMHALADMYNPQAIPELRATIQFSFIPPKTGQFNPGPANWYMNINEGSCSVHEGRTTMPTLAITTPNELWQDIGSGAMDAETAFTEGYFEADGSMHLLEQFPNVFQYPQPVTDGSALAELDAVMMGMPQAFNAKAAANLDGTIEFILGGTGGGIYQLHIKDGQCTAQRGAAVSATLTINAAADTWMAIVNGELVGQEAFMAGKYRASGDMNMMMKMGDLFTTAGANTDTPELSSAENPPRQDAPAVAENQNNCHDTIANMAGAFQADVAGDISADIQFIVSGDEPGSYYLQIDNGLCTFNEGQAASPTLCINTPSDIWLAVSRGEMEGSTAFMESKYTAEGDFALLMKMGQLFETSA